MYRCIEKKQQHEYYPLKQHIDFLIKLIRWCDSVVDAENYFLFEYIWETLWHFITFACTTHSNILSHVLKSTLQNETDICTRLTVIKPFHT